MIAYRGESCEIHQADALEVAASLEPGSCSLAIVDGPYAMGIAEWDKMGLDSLADWYAPHLDALGRVCGASATAYLWNTAEGWARLDVAMRARGWRFKVLIVWDKQTTIDCKTSPELRRQWADVVEVCGMYQREAWAPNTCAGQEIGYAAGRDERNWVREFLAAEWDATCLRRGEADKALGTNGMAGHYFGASQWALPTWENYQRLAAYAAEHGTPRPRPYFVLESVAQAGDSDHLRASYDHLRASYDHLRAEYDHLRAEYEASRPVFNAAPGLTNVWSRPPVAGRERLSHPCQKPVEFATRMLLASSRPGDRVWVPFGGTMREAVAAIRLRKAGAGRFVVAAETDPGHVAAAVRVLRVEDGERGLFEAVA